MSGDIREGLAEPWDDEPGVFTFIRNFQHQYKNTYIYPEKPDHIKLKSKSKRVCIMIFFFKGVGV